MRCKPPLTTLDPRCSPTLDPHCSQSTPSRISGPDGPRPPQETGGRAAGQWTHLRPFEGSQRRHQRTCTALMSAERPRCGGGETPTAGGVLGRGTSAGHASLTAVRGLGRFTPRPIHTPAYMGVAVCEIDEQAWPPNRCYDRVGAMHTPRARALLQCLLSACTCSWTARCGELLCCYL